MFDAVEYWRNRYLSGGDSGDGSHAEHLARFKADVVADALTRYECADVIDLGCGDGHITRLVSRACICPVYGSDPAIAPRTDAGFAMLDWADVAANRWTWDAALSLDVLYHLVDKRQWVEYLDLLFGCARRLVVIYAPDAEVPGCAPHVAPRQFTGHIAEAFPRWRLVGRVANPFAPEPGALPADGESWSEFCIYRRIDNAVA